MDLEGRRSVSSEREALFRIGIRKEDSSGKTAVWREWSSEPPEAWRPPKSLFSVLIMSFMSWCGDRLSHAREASELVREGQKEPGFVPSCGRGAHIPRPVQALRGGLGQAFTPVVCFSAPGLEILELERGPENSPHDPSMENQGSRL